MTPKNDSSRKSASNVDLVNDQGRHFDKIFVDNYRYFKEFSMGSFERVNLVGGKNNVGKTALLEALFLLLGGTNISVILKLNSFRGIDLFEGDAVSIRETLWKHYFRNFDDQAAISIESQLGNGKKIGILLKQITGIATTFPLSGAKTDAEGSEPLITGAFPPQTAISSSEISSQALQLQYTDANGQTYSTELRVDAKGITLPPPLVEPLFQGIIHPARRRPSSKENAERYGQLEIVQDHFDLIPSLKVIEPRLKRLSTIIGASGPMLYADIGLGRMLPLLMLGDGLLNLASLLISIPTAAGGVVLIDEIENGFHYSILEKVWASISEAARRYDTQIFATTHSFECIEAAHKAFLTSDYYDFRYHRLQSEDDHIKAVTFDKDMLQTTVEAGWEIR